MKNNFLRIFSLISSIFFIGIGIYRNEIKTVLTKAINICLECIGVG